MGNGALYGHHRLSRHLQGLTGQSGSARPATSTTGFDRTRSGADRRCSLCARSIGILSYLAPMQALTLISKTGFVRLYDAVFDN